MIVISLFLAASFLSCFAKESHDGFKVFRLKPTNEQQIEYLSHLEQEDNTLDFWSGVNKAGIPVDVMVKPENQEKFIRTMKGLEIPIEDMIDNVQERIETEHVQTLSRAGMNWNSYYKLEDIYTWFNELARKNKEVSVINIGKSEEGRSIKGVKVSFKKGNRAVFLEGGIHAREWISPATVTYILNELLTSDDPTFRKIAKSFDWYVFPVVNPDGYAYTHSTNRLWRKTRSGHGECIGADPNRNWNAHWGEYGASNETCSEIYAGSKAFSEKETARLSEFLRSVGRTLDVYLGFHSYSQLMLLPYGHTEAHLTNYDDVKKIGDAAAESLAKRYGTKYQVGSIAEIIFSAKASYYGYKVFRLQPNNEKQNEFLSQLEAENYTLDFWRGVNNAGIPVDVMVRPEDQKSFIRTMRNFEINADVMIEDVQDRIDADRAPIDPKAGMHWKDYHNLEAIYRWLESLSVDNPAVSVIDLGITEEGASLKGVKVSFNSGLNKTKRAVFLEGGIHAREWISPATVTYILNEMLTSKDPTIRKIAESFDWYVFPVVNPSGYAYSHTTDRLWRKTRTPYSPCYGADPNRNWDMRWGGIGSSDKPCKETYRGPKPFSENATRQLSEYIRGIGSTLDLYLSFHSFSQLLMLPYGYTTEHLDNYDEVKKIGDAAAVSLAKRYGTLYDVGNIAETINYYADGVSSDWVKKEFKTKIVLTYELRDTGEDGFLLPREQIIPNCEEVVDSIVTIFQEAEKLGYFTVG